MSAVIPSRTESKAIKYWCVLWVSAGRFFNNQKLTHSSHYFLVLFFTSILFLLCWTLHILQLSLVQQSSLSLTFLSLFYSKLPHYCFLYYLLIQYVLDPPHLPTPSWPPFILYFFSPSVLLSYVLLPISSCKWCSPFHKPTMVPSRNISCPLETFNVYSISNS